MPEGPEIRRAADRIAKAIVGRELVNVRFGLTRLEPYANELIGTRVESVRPRGKALLTLFDTGRVLYSHNQLYGRWYVVAAGNPPRTGRSLRVALETESKWALLYSASDIELLDADDVDAHPFIAKLGPDVLDEGTPPRVIAKRLASKRFERRSLGALLLDQSFVAGLGNYLRSEILFFAGLHPSLRPCDLCDEQRTSLARLIRSITKRAYTTGGVTEEPTFVAEAKADGEPRRTWRHAVFGRADAPCRRCGEPIERIEVGSRRLYLCPWCQG
jgi:endonuclease VIII